MTVRPRHLHNPRTQCGANRTPRFTSRQSAAQKQQRGEMIRPDVRENETPRRTRYLAARELRQVGFEVLSNHRVDGNQTEHAGLANAALRVVIALQGGERRQHQAGHARRRARTHTLAGGQRERGRSRPPGAEYTQTFPGTNKANKSNCPNKHNVQICLFGADTPASLCCNRLD